MIRTATQLKAKVRNLSGSDSNKAQTLIRNFVMERFLERLTLSEYRDHFILKGGMLVAAMVGLDTRATMDIDTTVKALNLSREDAVKVIEDIIAVNVPDGVQFKVTKVADIMEEHDYPGIRLMLEATLDRMQQTIKLDISTGDIITPAPVEYNYHLMFEERTISLWAYNLETLLAEKLETIMSRGTANTRMRDFYDIHVISLQECFDTVNLRIAFLATCQGRNSIGLISQLKEILHSVEEDETMRKLWENYREASFFVGDLPWETVMLSVKELAEKAIEGMSRD